MKNKRKFITQKNIYLLKIFTLFRGAFVLRYIAYKIAKQCFKLHINNKTVIVHLYIRYIFTQFRQVGYITYITEEKQELNVGASKIQLNASFHMYRSSPDAKLACLIYELL